MRIAVCITTMNRPQELDNCIKTLWDANAKPYAVVVSDNSTDAEVQRRNRAIVESYAHSAYYEGPHTGVTANRNNALKAVPPEADLVIFLADDIDVSADFFELAISRYQKLPGELREKTILTGDNRNEFSPPDIGPLGVTFHGFFCPLKRSTPPVVNLYATLFPKAFLDKEQWDENIFLGQEDIELSLRALKRGYQICYCPELKVFDTCFGINVSSTPRTPVNQYEIYVAASRLYIGIKRYKHIFPNALKLLLFQLYFALNITKYLFQRRSLKAWPKILQESNVSAL